MASSRPSPQPSVTKTPRIVVRNDDKEKALKALQSRNPPQAAVRNVHELLCIFNSEIVAMRNLNAAGKKKVPNAPAIEQELPRPEAPGPSGDPAPQPIEGTPVPAQIGNSYKVKAASCIEGVGAAIIKETEAAAQACPTIFLLLVCSTMSKNMWTAVLSACNNDVDGVMAMIRKGVRPVESEICIKRRGSKNAGKILEFLIPSGLAPTSTPLFLIHSFGHKQRSFSQSWMIQHAWTAAWTGRIGETSVMLGSSMDSQTAHF